MKRKNTVRAAASLIAIAGILHAAVPLAATSEEDTIYGTMNIPYNEFYEAEFGKSTNRYEVDAVSSATTSKWSMNGTGQMFEGTYNEPNGDGTGKILGVTFPVAITQTDLEALGSSDYGFTQLDSKPAAYKNVTVTDGKASFSAVWDKSPEIADSASIKLGTTTSWGDYIINVENKPEMGAIYGALIKTADGNTYAMCHEQNIFRGELAWSSGIRTSEPHGNKLSYENFVGLMGATITDVTFITLNGYVTIPANVYVPVKFAGEVKVENSTVDKGKTAFELVGFPDDFDKTCTLGHWR